MMTQELPFEKVQQLVRTVRKLSLSRDLNSIMEVVRSHGRELLDADGVTFVLKDGEMCYYADEDAIAPLWKGSRFPMDTCISGWSMKNGRAAVIEDIYEDSRIPVDVYRPTFVKSLIMAPIRSKDPIGAIGIYWAEEHQPSEEEVELARSLGEVTAVVMENVTLYNDLEKRVEERTTRLEAFSYSVAHDLKNPLAGMEMRLRRMRDILEEGQEDEMGEIASDLEEGVERMKELINGLLKFSLMKDEGLQKENTDMNGIVNTLVEQIRERYPDKKIEIQVEELAEEYVDPTLFQRAWANILSNAVKYSKKDEPLIVEIEMTERRGKRIYSIKDNGIGFRPERAEDIFKPFHRSTTDPEIEGSGIGLSLTQQIILRHGGDIWAEGWPGEGAVFHFSLPWEHKGRELVSNFN